ncbi:hypothetical protein LMG28614_06858 [Paraburkholderia ultramafica]|uniref:Uncharacterized protein n=1 Tax=Paraburkholderia ultramafica TaxID=1544867 RepID=A0A6S7BPY7_9BURK|nr:hypothetical protein [Paraburkholderia ultramafica]CAB3808673.1 hypothetical protein LMG28614_06858 [Paraburkholderia ultramafica]
MINDQLTLVRLHGRNHETWNIKDASAASDRFNYDYYDAELAEQINGIAALVARTHVKAILKCPLASEVQMSGFKGARICLSWVADHAVSKDPL